MRVLGIDPGFERVGIAVIEKSGAQKEELVFSECFKTSAQESFPERLRFIGEEVGRVIDTYTPNVLATETLLFNSNQKTAMRVAEARGVMIYEARRRGLSVEEYTPLQIKVAVAGYGKADKKQVEIMTRNLIAVPHKVRHDDEIDAIAAGITCLASMRCF